MSDLERELDAAEDIVVLMRKWAEVLDIPSGSFVNDDCRKAANEITRLRNELHIAQEWSAKVIAGREEDIGEITRLRAEVERLRAALEEVMEWSKPYDRVHIIARAALEDR